MARSADPCSRGAGLRSRIAEQHRIVAKLDALTARLRRSRSELTGIISLSDTLRQQAKLLDRLESLLLAKAFRGELVPQDPTDEPASVLLERIGASRAIAPTSKGKRGRKSKIDVAA